MALPPEYRAFLGLKLKASFGAGDDEEWYEGEIMKYHLESKRDEAEFRWRIKYEDGEEERCRFSNDLNTLHLKPDPNDDAGDTSLGATAIRPKNTSHASKKLGISSHKPAQGAHTAAGGSGISNIPAAKVNPQQQKSHVRETSMAEDTGKPKPQQLHEQGKGSSMAQQGIKGKLAQPQHQQHQQLPPGKKKIVLLESAGVGRAKGPAETAAGAGQKASAHPAKAKPQSKVMNFSGDARPTLQAHRPKPGPIHPIRPHNQPPPQVSGAPGTPVGRSLGSSPKYEPGQKGGGGPTDGPNGSQHRQLTIDNLRLAAAGLTGPVGQSNAPASRPAGGPTSTEADNLQAKLASLLSSVGPAIARSSSTAAGLSPGANPIMAGALAPATAGLAAGAPKVVRLPTRGSVANELEEVLANICSSKAYIKLATMKAIECAKEVGAAKTMQVLLERLKLLSDKHNEVVAQQHPARTGIPVDSNEMEIVRKVKEVHAMRLYLFYLVDSLMQRSIKEDAEPAFCDFSRVMATALTPHVQGALSDENHLANEDAEPACRDFPKVVGAALNPLVQGALSDENNLAKVKRILEIWENKNILHKSYMSLGWEAYNEGKRRIGTEAKPTREIQLSLPGRAGTDPIWNYSIVSPLMVGRRSNICGPITARAPIPNQYGSFGRGLSAAVPVRDPRDVSMSGLPPQAAAGLESIMARFCLLPRFKFPEEEIIFDEEDEDPSKPRLSWRRFLETKGWDCLPEARAPEVMTAPLTMQKENLGEGPSAPMHTDASGDVGLTPVEIVSMEDDLYDPAAVQSPAVMHMPLLQPLQQMQRQQQVQQQAMAPMYEQDTAPPLAPGSASVGHGPSTWDSVEGFMFAPGAPTHSTRSTGRSVIASVIEPLVLVLALHVVIVVPVLVAIANPIIIVLIVLVLALRSTTNVLISAIMTTNVTNSNVLISAIMTTNVTTTNVLISAIMTTNVTTTNVLISAIMTTNALISVAMTTNVMTTNILISVLMTTNVTTATILISVIMTTNILISVIMTTNILISVIMTTNILISVIMTTNILISVIMTSNVTTTSVLISAIMTTYVTTTNVLISVLMAAYVLTSVD
eukprot:gene26301-17394_t